MKTGEAEVWLRQQLATVYEAREAANIAALVLEDVTHLPRIDRIVKKDEPIT
jgi:hypothetical protein